MERETSCNDMRRMEEAKEDNWCWDWTTKGNEASVFGPKMSMVLFNWFNWFTGAVAVFGTRKLNGGHFYWEMQTGPHMHFGTGWGVDNPVPDELNDFMMFGVGTKETRVSSDHADNLIGETDQSWGLDSRGQIWHNGQRQEYLPQADGPSIIGVYFDGAQGTISFSVNGNCPKVAFEGLDAVKKDIFPIVASTIYKSELFLLKQRCDYPSLSDRCRSVITQRIIHPSQTRTLGLPRTVESYVNEELELPHGLKRGANDINGLETAKWIIDMHSVWYVDTTKDRRRRVIVWLLRMAEKLIKECNIMHRWYFMEKNISEELSALYDYWWISRCNGTIRTCMKRILSQIKTFEGKTDPNCFYWFPTLQKQIIHSTSKSPPLEQIRRDSLDGTLLRSLGTLGLGRSVQENPLFGSGQRERDLCVLRGIQSSVRTVNNHSESSAEQCHRVLRKQWAEFRSRYQEPWEKLAEKEAAKEMLWKMIRFFHKEQPLGVTYIRTCCYMCEVFSREN